MGSSLRLLIVDDAEADATLMKRELRRSGYELTTRRVDTAEGVTGALSSEPWDLVLSDFQMPGLTGFEALRLVREHSADLPFVVVSGTIGEELAVELLRAGANDYLLKDRMARLGAAVERALREADERRVRREAQEALRESEERFRTLVDSMDDVVFSLDRHGRIDGLYGRVPAEFGPVAQNVIGQSLSELFGGHDVLPPQQAVQQALGGHQTLFELAFDTGSGVRTFHIRLSARRDAGGEITGLVGIGRDITSQKEVQAQLATADRMASIGLIAAGVAHEVNSPLAALLLNAELAQRITRRTESSGSQLATSLESIHDCGQRIARIVRDLGVFSRAPAEQLELVDVRQVLDASLRLTEGQLRSRARLVREDDDVPLVLANGSRLGQVFLNLILNAAQAIPEGDYDHHEVRIATRAEGDARVVIEVRDTGVGIAPEVVAKLFTPFFTTKPVGVGTGLGLSICQRLLKAMGGGIEVESQPGKGSVFRVSLPVASAVEFPPAPPTPPRLPSGTRRIHRPEPRVLVIDDNAHVRASLRQALGESYDTVAVGSAREGLALLEQGESFAVVVCDLMMGDLTGIDFHARLHLVAPRLVDQVIFLSGGAYTPAAKEFLARVPNLRLEKPFDLAKLKAMVDWQMLHLHEGQASRSGNGS